LRLATRPEAEALEHLENRGKHRDVIIWRSSKHRCNGFQELLELTFDPVRIAAHRGVCGAAGATEPGAESVTDLLRQNWRLLTRKMVERSGETGEHYIARSRQEYGVMLKRAAGGGAIMAVTAWLKTIILSWNFAELMQGIAASGIIRWICGDSVDRVRAGDEAAREHGGSPAARMHNVRSRLRWRGWWTKLRPGAVADRVHCGKPGVGGADDAGAALF